MSDGDDALAARVRENLRSDGHVSAAEFVVTAHGGRVRLEGTVPSYREKLAAMEVVARTPGVRRIDDDVTIEPAARLADADITRLVGAALADGADTPETQIAVSVRKGHVTLSGNVPAISAWYAAQEAALGCEGVLSVRNLLLVDPVAVREDAEIVDEIAGLLERERHLDASGVEVRCVDGCVFLGGWVGSLPEKARAERAAARVHGIRALENRIRVR